MAEFARRMVAAVGGGLMGVDVLTDAGGRHWALEANAPFGFDITDPGQRRFVATWRWTSPPGARPARDAA
jgi:hypothetical protein